MNRLTIRQEESSDHETIFNLVIDAFAGTEHCDGDEQELVERLRKCAAFVPELSLVAECDGKIVGHVMFITIRVGGAIALCLAAVSVLPNFQKQGIGAALIVRGHTLAAEMGYDVCVLFGHPDYYSRFGYERASEVGITIPFKAPDECVMVKFLTDEGRSISGAAVFPPEFH